MEEKKTIKRKIKKVMHILNPFAGKGNAKKVKESLDGSDFVYMSESSNDASEFIKKSCMENPDTCFTVYGGDGTVFKAVNALMESGCADKASLKVVPIGSGNDFVRTFDGFSGETEIDILTFNGRYAANVINMGFDCSVVKRVVNLKKSPLIPGKLAYTFGVAGEIFNKKPMDATVTLMYADGTQEILKEKFLLIAAGNCCYYGGGFKAAPAAKYDDGLIDVALVRNVSVPTFISLVADYKKGSFVNSATGEVCEKFKKFVIYKKCIGLKVHGCGSVCADGEIFDENDVEIGIIPKAINLIVD
jgi:diacylglycerol kinase family enzyme